MDMGHRGLIEDHMCDALRPRLSCPLGMYNHRLTIGTISCQLHRHSTSFANHVLSTTTP